MVGEKSKSEWKMMVEAFEISELGKVLILLSEKKAAGKLTPEKQNRQSCSWQWTRVHC